MRLRIGIREGELARIQGEHVAATLARHSDGDDAVDVELVPVTAEGVDDPEEANDPTVYVAALRVALVSGECDAVLHDLRDLPFGEPDELELAAILERRDAREALVAPSADLDEWGAAVKVASYPRRAAAQLVAMRPGLVAVDGPASVEQLLELPGGDEAYAVVVPLATLGWLGRADAAVRTFEVDEVVPAAGQGVLAVEARSDATEDVRAVLAGLDHEPTRIAVTAERAVLAALEAEPDLPVGAHARVEGGDVILRVRVVSATGELSLSDRAKAPVARAEWVGQNSGALLVGRGARRVMRTS